MKIEFYDELCYQLKLDVFKDIEFGRLNSALRKIQTIRYVEELNVLYKDDILEKACIDIANKIIPNEVKYNPRKDHFLFCDSLMWDSHGLTQQYLKALMSLNKKILYLKTGCVNRKNDDILKLLKSYDRVEILYLPEVSPVNQILFIYDAILDFKPEKIFMHSFSILDVVALFKITSCERYRIDLGNHLTWIGVCSTDYVIEFNDFGCNVAVQKRGFSEDNVFKHPMYPILDTNLFEGFPIDKNDKVFMYTGGAMYKIRDNENTFLNILKNLLLDNDSLVIFFSIRDDDGSVKKFVTENYLENRLILLGYRDDIYEVFSHIDIFLQTYPIGGGLMEKYAMLCSKPILCYCTMNNFERYSQVDDNDILLDLESYKKAYVDKTLFYEEAKRLIDNESYRIFIGKTLNSLVENEKSFNDRFLEILLHKNNDKYKIKYKEVNYDILRREYDEIRLLSEDMYILNILATYGFYVIFLCPKLIWIKLFKIIKILCKYIFRKFFSFVTL